MSKKKEITEKMAHEEIDFYQSLAKDVGGELLDDMDNCVGFIDTGILALNYIISGRFVGGGFPVGSLAEVSGESATGKSLLGTNFLRGCQIFNGEIFTYCMFSIMQ